MPDQLNGNLPGILVERAGINKSFPVKALINVSKSHYISHALMGKMICRKIILLKCLLFIKRLWHHILFR